jgi:hypothetical protein
MHLGDLEFQILTDGTIGLDGGAMFGVIPKPLWEKVAPADARNRIRLAMNCLLIRAAGKLILVESGAGDKWSAKESDIYDLHDPHRLPQSLSGAGVRPEDIDFVVNTHLHFDHCGWNTRREGDRIVPTFPNARYVVQRGAYEHGKAPTERDRGSFRDETFGTRSWRRFDPHSGPHSRHAVCASLRGRPFRTVSCGSNSDHRAFAARVDHGIRSFSAYDARIEEVLDSEIGARRNSRIVRARHSHASRVVARAWRQIRR